jgi:hypothetical protein
MPNINYGIVGVKQFKPCVALHGLLLPFLVGAHLWKVRGFRSAAGDAAYLPMTSHAVALRLPR